jgi:hypothetical protein
MAGLDALMRSCYTQNAVMVKELAWLWINIPQRGPSHDDPTDTKKVDKDRLSDPQRWTTLDLVVASCPCRFSIL